MLKHFLLPVLALSIVAIAVPAIAQERANTAPASDSQILHVIERLTFGPRPGDIEAVRKVGLQNWMQSQLHPESIAENPALEERLLPLASLKMNLVDSAANRNAGRTMVFAVTSFDAVGVPTVRNANASAAIQDLLAVLEETRANNMMSANRTPEMDLKDGKLYRALYSNRQLEEVLVDFWFNHFNVTFSKGAPFVADYEREAIRPYVLGKFKDMLVATALHPAMLQYLDNKASIAPEISQPKGPNMTFSFAGAHGLNENFSRELMELHTLGVDGGYTQKDIEAAARCFTGWNLVQTSAVASTGAPAKIEYGFVEWPHDFSEKTVLGHTIRGSGQDEVYELLDILASHPSTARHISKQLAERFVSDHPPQSLVDRMARTFSDTDGDLRAVMTTMLTSAEFLSESERQAKFKSPLELAASALRALNADVADLAELEQSIEDMGEPLYGKLEPTGYPNTGEGWLAADLLLARVNFAMSLAAGKIKGVSVDVSIANDKDTLAMAQDILNLKLSPQTVDALKAGQIAEHLTPEMTVGLILGSPDFQRK